MRVFGRILYEITDRERTHYFPLRLLARSDQLLHFSLHAAQMLTVEPVPPSRQKCPREAVGRLPHASPLSTLPASSTSPQDRTGFFFFFFFVAQFFAPGRKAADSPQPQPSLRRWTSLQADRFQNSLSRARRSAPGKRIPPLTRSTTDRTQTAAHLSAGGRSEVLPNS